MKRIELIIKGRKFTEKLFGLKKKQINRALEAAADYAEKTKEDAAIAYEALFNAMAEDKADYQGIISKMIGHKQTIISANATLKAIAEIRADLDAEVEAAEDNEK